MLPAARTMQSAATWNDLASELERASDTPSTAPSRVASRRAVWPSRTSTVALFRTQYPGPHLAPRRLPCQTKRTGLKYHGR